MSRSGASCSLTRSRSGPPYGHNAVHQLCLVFECHLAPGCEPNLPGAPDPNQVGVRWVPLDELASVNLLPRLGAELVAAFKSASGAELFDLNAPD